jgi:hypothetical protein
VWIDLISSRLGCQIILDETTDGITVTIPSATRNLAVDGHKPAVRARHTSHPLTNAETLNTAKQLKNAAQTQQFHSSTAHSVQRARSVAKGKASAPVVTLNIARCECICVDIDIGIREELMDECWCMQILLA